MRTKKTYQERKEAARQIAITWQYEAGQKNYSYFELATFGNYFHTLGIRFGLLREFRENAIPC